MHKMNLHRYDLSYGYNPIEGANISPCGDAIIVKHEQALVGWNLDTRLPLSHILHFGNALGFSADGTLFVTKTGQTQWLWGIAD